METGFHLRDTDTEDLINQNKMRSNERNTIDMYDYDRYTDDSRNPEVKDSLYL